MRFNINAKLIIAAIPLLLVVLLQGFTLMIFNDTSQNMVAIAKKFADTKTDSENQISIATSVNACK